MEVLLVILVAGGSAGLLATMAMWPGEWPRPPRQRRPERRSGALAPSGVREGRLDPWLELRREVMRSRRTERPLTVLRLTGSAADVPRAAATAVAAHVREVDLVWIDGDAIYLLLPDTGTAAVPVLVRRLQAHAGRALAGRRVTWATFPDDALTTEALVQRLREGAPTAKRRGRSRPGPLRALPPIAATDTVAPTPVGVGALASLHGADGAEVVASGGRS